MLPYQVIGSKLIYIIASVLYSQLGSVQHTTLASDTDEATRESLLKAHLGKRIEELNSQLQQADSKAVAYHAECRALGKRLQISTKAKQKAQGELTVANSTISRLQVGEGEITWGQHGGGIIYNLCCC